MPRHYSSFDELFKASGYKVEKKNFNIRKPMQIKAEL